MKDEKTTLKVNLNLVNSYIDFELIFYLFQKIKNLKFKYKSNIQLDKLNKIKVNEMINPELGI